MKILLSIIATIVTALSAFAAPGPPFLPILRNSVTTNSYPKEFPSAGDVLIWDAVHNYWTNGTTSATVTNAINDINGNTSNHQFIVVAPSTTSNTFGIQSASGAAGASNIFHVPIASTNKTGMLSSNDWNQFRMTANSNLSQIKYDFVYDDFRKIKNAGDPADLGYAPTGYRWKILADALYDTNAWIIQDGYMKSISSNHQRIAKFFIDANSAEFGVPLRNITRIGERIRFRTGPNGTNGNQICILGLSDTLTGINTPSNLWAILHYDALQLWLNGGTVPLLLTNMPVALPGNFDFPFEISMVSNTLFVTAGPYDFTIEHTNFHKFNDPIAYWEFYGSSNATILCDVKSFWAGWPTRAQWQIAAGRSNITVAAGANVTVVTNLDGTHTTYTVSSLAQGITNLNNSQFDDGGTGIWSLFNGADVTNIIVHGPGGPGGPGITLPDTLGDRVLMTGSAQNVTNSPMSMAYSFDGLVDGQALVYKSAMGKWTNASAVTAGLPTFNSAQFEPTGSGTNIKSGATMTNIFFHGSSGGPALSLLDDGFAVFGVTPNASGFTNEFSTYQDGIFVLRDTQMDAWNSSITLRTNSFISLGSAGGSTNSIRFNDASYLYAGTLDTQETNRYRLDHNSSGVTSNNIVRMWELTNALSTVGGSTAFNPAQFEYTGSGTNIKSGAQLTNIIVNGTLTTVPQTGLSNILFSQNGAVDGTNDFLFSRATREVYLKTSGTSGLVGSGYKVTDGTSTNYFTVSAIGQNGNGGTLSFVKGQFTPMQMVTNAIYPALNLLSSLGQEDSSGTTNRFASGYFRTINTSNILLKATAMSISGTNYVADGTIGSSFTNQIAMPGNINFINMQDGVPMWVKGFVSNGVTMQIWAEGAPVAVTNFIDGNSRLVTNAWNLIKAWRNGNDTNFWVINKGYNIATDGGLALHTNYPSGLITISNALVTAPLTNQVNYFTPNLISPVTTSNFTLQATIPEMVINGKSNVVITAVMSYSTDSVLYWNCSITNGSGGDRSINFPITTNVYRFSGVYGTNMPTILTNNTTLLISGRSSETNTLIGYTYFAWP